MPIVTYSLVRKERRRGGRGRPTNERLEQLNDRFSKVVSADLSRGLSRFASRANYDHMADAVYSGDYRKVLQTIPFDQLPDDLEAAMGRLGDSISEASGVGANQLGLDPKRYSLRPDNPKVDEYLDVRSGELITRITDDVQVSVQQAVRRGLEDFQTPRQIADQIKQGGIGLNQRQEQALANYKASLTEQGIQGARFDAMVGRQAAAYLDQRAMMIARTEVSNAQNFAQVEVWASAQAEGLLPQDATKVWQVDGDPCPICRELGGTAVGLHENFVTTEGVELGGPPVHPHCRCVLLLGSAENS